MKIEKPSAQNESTPITHLTSPYPSTEQNKNTDGDIHRAFNDSAFLIHAIDATTSILSTKQLASDNADTTAGTSPDSDAVARRFSAYLGVDGICVCAFDSACRRLQPLIKFAGGRWVDVLNDAGLAMPEKSWRETVSTEPVEKNTEVLQVLNRLMGEDDNASNGDYLWLDLGDSASPAGLIAAVFTDGGSTLDERRRGLCREFGRLLLSWFKTFDQERQLARGIQRQQNIAAYCQSLFHHRDTAHGWRVTAANLFTTQLPPSQDPLAPLPFAGAALSDDESTLVTSKLERCLAAGEGFQFNYQVHDSNGQQHFINSRIDRWIPHEGQTAQLIACSRDVTETRKKERQALKQAETEQWLVSHTNTLFNSADLPAVDRALREIASFVGATRCSVRIREPKTQDWNFICQWHSPTMPPQMNPNEPAFKRILSKLVQHLKREGKATVVSDNLAETVDTELLDFHIRAGVRSYIIQPMYFEDQLVGYMALLSNERRQWNELEQRASKVSAEAVHMVLMRLRLMDSYSSSEERMQMAMAVTHYGMWEHDLKNQRMIYSPTYLSILGYQPGDLSERDDVIEKLLHPDDVEKTIKKVEQDYQTADGIVFVESRHRTKDGNYRWIQTKGKVIERDVNGGPTRVLGANTDITDLKSTLNELKVARAKAEKANIAKSEFLARMSHEIRTPMNAIIGLAYLSQQSVLTEEQKSHLQDIESAGNSLLHIIDDILDFSKIEAGQLSIESQEFNLIEELQRIMKLMSVRADQNDVELSFTAAPDVPARVVGDQTRVSQIITNLLSNAIKFTKQGRVALTVQNLQDSIARETQTLTFAVSDSGIGLSQQQIANLFQPFTQADGSTSRKYGGTGLGLSISKHLVEMMGGSINVISKPNVGTTFHFSIVFKKAGKDSVKTSKKLQQPLIDSSYEKDDTSLQGKRVLLVEDNIVNQKVATGLLKKVGVLATIANNGQEALQLLMSDSGRYHAVLMDIEMPIMDGLSTTMAIRQMDCAKHIPIIALTAHAMKGDREKCLEAGMNDYIAKPIKPDMLYRALRQFCC